MYFGTAHKLLQMYEACWTDDVWLRSGCKRFFADADYSSGVLSWVVGEWWLGIMVRGHMEVVCGVVEDELVKSADEDMADGDYYL